MYESAPHPSIPKGGYRLRTSVHCCKVGDVFIFLDLERDRYVSLTPRQSAWFEDILYSELPALHGSAPDTLAKHLVDGGLLVRDETLKAPPRLPPTSARYTFLIGETDCLSRPYLLADIVLLFCALVHTRLVWLRRADLLKVLHKFSRWTQYAEAARAAPEERVIQLTQVFHHLTPYFLTTRDTCFFKSLVLARYLSLRGVACRLTFAVRIAPFAAHCWLEREGLVLNEQEDIVCAYTPIASV
ncbi:MAG: lasso peptide biosynthesis B2 protein [Hyphomonas sp.]